MPVAITLHNMVKKPAVVTAAWSVLLASCARPISRKVLSSSCSSACQHVPLARSYPPLARVWACYKERAKVKVTYHMRKEYYSENRHAPQQEAYIHLTSCKR